MKHKFCRIPSPCRDEKRAISFPHPGVPSRRRQRETFWGEDLWLRRGKPNWTSFFFTVLLERVKPIPRHFLFSFEIQIHRVSLLSLDPFPPAPRSLCNSSSENWECLISHSLPWFPWLGLLTDFWCTKVVFKFPTRKVMGSLVRGRHGILFLGPSTAFINVDIYSNSNKRSTSGLCPT